MVDYDCTDAMVSMRSDGLIIKQSLDVSDGTL